MHASQHEWPNGTGRWSRARTLVMSQDDRSRSHDRDDVVVVTTPLDLIHELERTDHLTSTVVLTGAFAANRDLATFLVDFYPAIQILEGRNDRDRDVYLPSYG